MGLDVGVVKIDYLDRPDEPTYGFLRYLVIHVCAAEWGGGWEGNAVLEATKRRMLALGRLYARQQDLSQYDRQKLTQWINELPWDSDAIMLHLNW